MDWVVTIPKKTRWEDYRREVAAVEADPDMRLYYRVAHIPKDMKPGDRCYVVWNGRVRGWMEILYADQCEAFYCETTGRLWDAGNYIVRHGKFHEVDGPEMTGFRGIRRYKS